MMQIKQSSPQQQPAQLQAVPAAPLIQIPQLDPKDVRVQDLIKRYPPPTNRHQCEEFVRARCVFSLRWKEDSDFCKIALKGRNADEDVDQVVLHRELPAVMYGGTQEWDRKFIAAARQLYWTWISLEKDKA